MLVRLRAFAANRAIYLCADVHHLPAGHTGGRFVDPSGAPQLRSPVRGGRGAGISRLCPSVVCRGLAAAGAVGHP